VVDLLAALQRSVDAAKSSRGETTAADEKPAKKTTKKTPAKKTTKSTAKKTTKKEPASKRKKAS